MKNTISYLEHSAFVKLDWKLLLKKISSGEEFLFFPVEVRNLSAQEAVMEMPSSEAAGLLKRNPQHSEREAGYHSLYFALVWMVMDISHRSRYYNLAACQKSLIFFSGAESSGVEKPGGYGCANTGAVRRKSYRQSAALTHTCDRGSGSNGEAKYSKGLIALHWIRREITQMGAGAINCSNPVQWWSEQLYGCGSVAHSQEHLSAKAFLLYLVPAVWH